MIMQLKKILIIKSDSLLIFEKIKLINLNLTKVNVAEALRIVFNTQKGTIPQGFNECWLI